MIQFRAQILEKNLRHVYSEQFFTHREFQRESFKSDYKLPSCITRALRTYFGLNCASRVNNFSSLLYVFYQPLLRGNLSFFASDSRTVKKLVRGEQQVIDPATDMLFEKDSLKQYRQQHLEKKLMSLCYRNYFFVVSN